MCDMALIGRLHPLLVHFPIGLVLIAAVAEVVAMATGLRDCRSIDTGNLDPGAFSSPRFLEATGAYHCTIHPVMVGTIQGQ
jgi:uncharacterized membrane protein